MATRKEYEMLFQLNAEMSPSYRKSFTEAQRQVASMQSELQNFGRMQADISAYQKQQNAVEQTRKKLDMLKQQYDNIQREIQETGSYSSKLENQLLAKQRQIDRTTDALDRQTGALDEMGRSLEEAGIQTDDLTGESARLSAKMADLKQRQEQAADSAQSFGRKGQEAFSAVQEAVAAAGIAVALKEIYQGFMDVTEAAGDFHGSMSAVDAMADVSDRELAALTEQAKELGETTKFTAKESSEAMGYMAMAGWNAQEMLAGMPGVLSLAAAADEDLALVSDIVTDSLTAFNMTAADTVRFSDVMAQTATKSNTDVARMGETFRYVAPVAGALGYSVEDAALAIGLMANAGIKGSQSGTALRSMMTNLVKPTEQVRGYMDALGLSVTDASGSAKPFIDVLEEMRQSFGTLTEAQKAEYAAGIAGQEGMSGMLAIVNATDQSFRELADDINNSAGAAERMAKVRMDNLQGDVVLFESAMDSLKITMGEQFMPEMRTMYSTGTDLLNLANDFVKTSPGLVKGIGAFAGVMGTAVAGLTGYVAVSKVAVPLMQLMTASIPGVGPILAVVGGVAALTGALVALNAEANAGVDDLNDLTQAAQDNERMMEEAAAGYDATVESTMAAASVADHYIGRLRELEAVGLDTEKEQEEYHSILSLLCETVPELADQIDLTTDTIMGGTEALAANTEAWKRNALQQAMQDQLTEMYRAQSDVLIEAEKNRMGLARAEAELDAAERKRADATARMNELWAEAEEKASAHYEQYGTYVDVTSQLSSEYDDLALSLREMDDEIETAQRNVEVHRDAVDADAEAVAAATEEIDLATEAVSNLTGETEEGAEAAEESARQQSELSDAVNGVMNQVNELALSYEEAYAAAQESVGGQYAIWQEAAEVVAVSAAEINGALESQSTYWSEYSGNLEKLSARTAEIEGLSEMIATFADGSAESVNAIAGLANASDSDLKKIVANWKKVQEEQDAASGSLAALKTDFESQMDQLQSELAADVEAMDLGDEAAQSGRATIQGFINGANAKLPAVSAAYRRVAQAAIDAIDAKMDIHSPSRVMANRADMTWLGFIRETVAMQPKVAEAMGEVAQAAEAAAEVSPAPAEYRITAETTAEEAEERPREEPAYEALRRMYIEPIVPTPAEAEEAPNRWPEAEIRPLEEHTDQAPPQTVSVTFNIGGDASEETVERLESYGQDFAQRVLDVIEEADYDRQRRAFT